MVDKNQFSVSLECEVYLMQGSKQIGESSNIIPGEFFGWVSITTDDFDLSSDDVSNLLEVSHIDEEFARRLLDLCLENEKIRNFRQKNHDEIVVKDIWVSGYISSSYLTDVANDRTVDTVRDHNSDIRIVDN